MSKEERVKLVRTACPAHCGIDACGILAHVKGDRIVKLEPAEFPDERDKRICLRGLTSLDITYHPNRIKYPMKRVGKRGEGKFERISWEKAYEIIVKNFREISEKYGWKSIGWVLGGPGAGTTKFGAYLRLASLTQSTRVSAWGYGDAGLPCGSRVILGHQFPYIHLHGEFWQRKYPELLMVWATNPAESMPLQNMRKFMDAKEIGTQVIVVDPRFTVTASKADEYIGLYPGTDSALALGIMNIIFQNDLYDKEFILDHTNGAYLVRIDTGKMLRGKDFNAKREDAYVIWHEKSNSHQTVSRTNVKEANLTGNYTIEGIECKPALQLLIELASEYTPERTAEITGVDKDLIIKLAKRIGNSKKVVFLTHMGFTRTYHGDISLRGVISVAAITGNITTSVSSGYIPAALNWNPFLKAIPDKPSFHRIGILNLYDAVISGKPYPIKALWFAFINFLNQCANANKIIKEFYPKLDFIVQTELFMTPSARYADLILPVCSFFEFSDFMAQPYPNIQLQQKVIEPLYESKSDLEISIELSKKLGISHPMDGATDDDILRLISSRRSDIPDYDVMKQDGVLKIKMEAPVVSFKEQIEDPENNPFPTLSGKIEIFCEHLEEMQNPLIPPIPKYMGHPESYDAPLAAKYPLQLLTTHYKTRAHSIWHNVPWMREVDPHAVWINTSDAKERGVQDGDLVDVYNDRGRIRIPAKVTERIMPGVVNVSEGAWYDPDDQGVDHGGCANVLTNDDHSPGGAVHLNSSLVQVELAPPR